MTKSEECVQLQRPARIWSSMENVTEYEEHDQTQRMQSNMKKWSMYNWEYRNNMIKKCKK